MLFDYIRVNYRGLLMNSVVSIVFVSHGQTPEEDYPVEGRHHQQSETRTIFYKVL